MKYTETNQLVIKNALPSKEPGEDYFKFTITGKNTYNKPIWYEIVLNHGVENPEGRTERLLDKFLKFRLVETKDGVDKTVVDNASYEDIKSKKIWVNTIPANTRDNIEITYKLYMWISYDTKIGNTAGNDYDMETWNNKVYASVKISVNGDLEEKKLDGGILKDKISEKVTEDNSITDSDTGIIYLSGTNEDIDFNYVRYSGKIWRVTAIYPDGKLKMLSEENLSTVDSLYIGSDNIELYNSKNISEQLSEISDEEYAKAYEKATLEDNFLVNGYEWSTSNHRDGGGFINASGYRPLITLKGNLSISTGLGTKENPYELELDKEVGKINDKINTRLSGEYVKLEGKVYRIMKVEDNNSTKLISVDYVRNEDGSVMYKDFWSQNVTEYGGSAISYKDAVDSKNENYWGAYLNGSWLTSSLKEYLTEGTYELAAINDRFLSNSGYHEYGSWTGYVGLPAYGEMFASQLGENKSKAEEFF